MCVKNRTDDINVKAEVHGTVPDAVTDASDDLGDTKVVNVVCRDQLEPDGFVVLEVDDALRGDRPSVHARHVLIFKREVSIQLICIVFPRGHSSCA